MQYIIRAMAFINVCVAWALFGFPPTVRAGHVENYSVQAWGKATEIQALFKPEETASIMIVDHTVTLSPERVAEINAGLSRLTAGGWRPDEFRSHGYQLSKEGFYESGDKSPDAFQRGMYATAINYSVFLPDSVTVQISNTAKVPFWLPCLEAQLAISGDPGAMFFYAESPLVRLEALAASWASLDEEQQNYILGVCERMRPLDQLQLKLGLKATQERVRLRQFITSVENELLHGKNGRDMSFPQLEVRGVEMLEPDAFQVSLANTEFPDGVWVKKDASVFGAVPLGLYKERHGASVHYLQTRWRLPVQSRDTLLVRSSPDLVSKAKNGQYADLLHPGEKALSFVDLQKRVRELDVALERMEELSKNPPDELLKTVEGLNKFSEQHSPVYFISDDELEFHLRAEASRQAILGLRSPDA